MQSDFKKIPFVSGTMAYTLAAVKAIIKGKLTNRFKISIDGELYDDDKTYRLKANRINNLEKYVYSVTLRAAYRSVHVFMSYQFSDTFKSGTGPSIKPFSIGIGVRPF
jgi:hypothetical protein